MRDSYENYDSHKQRCLLESEETRDQFNWERIGEIGYQKCLDFYNKIKSPEYQKNQSENKIHISYLEGPRVEITGDEEKEYLIEFISKGDKVLYSNTIKNGMWTSCSRKYYTDWQIKVNGDIVDEFDLKGKRVLISLESKSLGDTIAWSPYAVEFAKKHDCKVILSTFHNDFFRNLESYKDIEFINPGEKTGCYAVYRIGWFKGEGKWDRFDCHPNQVNLIPLQQTATDILGLEYKEL
jgi:autotransporter strand-loop-strand O-heptosyltransferase